MTARRLLFSDVSHLASSPQQCICFYVSLMCMHMQIIETPEIFEIVWNIPLNNGHSKIKKSDRYLKSSEVCELPRRDGRQGVLRSQINFTPEGHVHIR